MVSVHFSTKLLLMLQCVNHACTLHVVNAAEDYGIHTLYNSGDGYTNTSITTALFVDGKQFETCGREKGTGQRMQDNNHT